jgi:glycosyltransferase involved in cell wall biosynthesis
MKPGSKEAVVIVPAFNEEESIASVVGEIRRHAPSLDIVVVNDGSADRTAAVARENGAVVLDLPFNLGIGEAVQAGFHYAYEEGYDFAVRCDGDGQHSPSDITRLLEVIRENDVDLVVGSRFLGEQVYSNTLVRNIGIFCLSWFLSLICRKRITDPTSGFQALNRPLLYFFSRSYPKDYPEPEALALMRRQGYDFMEVPVTPGVWGMGAETVKTLITQVALVVDEEGMESGALNALATVLLKSDLLPPTSAAGKANEMWGKVSDKAGSYYDDARRRYEDWQAGRKGS